MVSYGTLMFDVAKKNGLVTGMQLEKLSVSEQQKLQKIAAEKLLTQ